MGFLMDSVVYGSWASAHKSLYVREPEYVPNKKKVPEN